MAAVLCCSTGIRRLAVVGLSSKFRVGLKPIVQGIPILLSPLNVNLISASLNLSTEVGLGLNGWIAQYASVIGHEFSPLKKSLSKLSRVGADRRIQQILD
jgi:hypothetical protein